VGKKRIGISAIRDQETKTRRVEQLEPFMGDLGSSKRRPFEVRVNPQVQADGGAGVKN
jgi:hypothetical protein